MKKMLFKLLMVLSLLIGVTAWQSDAAAAAIAEQRSSLAGTVLAGQLAVVGQSVREGDVLLKVQTIGGAVPAARASSDGVVRQVLVHPGERVAAGQVVVKLEVR